MISDALPNILLQRGSKHSKIFIDQQNLNDLRSLPDQVKESKVMVAMLSKMYLTRPWCLIELFLALQFNIPIISINVIDAGYNFEEAKMYLESLSPETLDAVNHGASKEMEKLGIDISELGKQLVEILPNL